MERNTKIISKIISLVISGRIIRYKFSRQKINRKTFQWIYTRWIYSRSINAMHYDIILTRYRELRTHDLLTQGASCK